MATGGKKEIGSELLNIGTLTLKPDDLDPWGVVVVGDKVVITDWNSKKVRVYRRHDGMLMSSSDELESPPLGLCRVNDTDLCVAMIDGIITLMSVQDSGLISRGKTFHLPSFDRCHGVAAFRDNVVVSGWKDNTIYWCVVSLQDGRHDNLHKVCGGRLSWLTTKENMAYISCRADSIDDNGVYGFNLLNPSLPPYTYKHKGLSWPGGITVDDNGDLFVCDLSNSIHHLTEKCQLVDIYTLEGIPHYPWTIFWDSGILYVASFRTNVITLYRTPHQVLPAEIMRMDEKSKQLFMEALKKGEEKVYNIRVMVVGHGGVGKTTLIKRLLGKNVNIQERCATEGIDVDMHCCDVSGETFEWKVRQTDSDDSKEDALVMRVAKIVNEEIPKVKVGDQPKREKHPSKKHPDNEKHDRGGRSIVKHQVKISQEDKKSESKEQVLSTAGGEKQSKPTVNTGNISEVIGIPNTDLKGDMLHSLLCQKAPKLPQRADNLASLAVWDFAGQYAFYTTHQTFMTRRAIYLLVSDVSQKFDNPVNDECYLDSRGKIQCCVRDLAEVWLNSIHSCASSPEEGIPPVILVGTHVDQIRQGDRHEVCERYFKEVRTYLKDKPSRFHLVNEEFAIDNTVVDRNLENLKKKIVQVASQQKYWGENIPAQWLPLEQALMKLRHDGKKVIHRSVLEDLSARHQIATDQLELFLRFQHDIGMILYFSIEILKDNVVLDPKWMIDALKSLINANDMDVMRNNPKLSLKVSDFKKYGILYPDLIDAIWSKEQYRDFNGNKKHVLLLMERLNIIAKPSSYVESKLQMEKYFLVPCMLGETTPNEVVSPKPQPDMGSSSVLCYVFVEKFLPTPIFHRLIAACLAHWPIAKTNSENLIFCGCCVFDLDLHHRLTVFFRQHVIFVRVTRMGASEKIPSSKLCIEAKEFITMTLEDVIGYLGQCLRFELFIQCPEYDGFRVNCLIPVADLQGNVDVPCHFHDNSHVIISREMLEFWFQNENKLNTGRPAVQGQSRMPQTERHKSTTKSKPALPVQTPRAATNQLSGQIPSKPVNPKTKVQTATASVPSKPMNPKTKGQAATASVPSKPMNPKTKGQAATASVPSKPMNPKTKAQTATSQDKKVSSLPFSMQNEKPSERQIGRLSKKIGHEFFQLGLELGLSGADIQQIQKDYPHTATQCLKILIKWKEQCGDKATFVNLEKAFISVGIDVDILNSVDTAGDTVSCLPPSMLDKQPNDRQLNRICSRIGTGHVHLGVELEVPFSRIDQILAEQKDSVHRQCFEIMKEWRQRQAMQATFMNLQQAFRSVGINPDILKENGN